MKKFEIVKNGKVVYSVPCCYVSFSIETPKETRRVSHIDNFSGHFVSDGKTIKFILDDMAGDVIK